MEFSLSNGVSTLSAIRITQTVGTELVVHDFAEPMWHEIEVWRATVNDQAQAALVIRTPLRRFSDTKLTAGQSYWYWYRFARTMSTGEVHFGNWVSKQGATPLVPLAPVPANLSIDTIKLAPNAVTDRATYEETASEYVRIGTDENGNLVPAGEEVWTLPDITFTGTGDTFILTAICRQSETPMIFREGNASIWARVEASILDTTPNPDTVVDIAELTVSGWRAEQMPIAPTQWIATGTNRDFTHNFVFPTIAAHVYALRFKLTVGSDNPDNYILWATDLRQVLIEIFKK